MSQGIFPVRQPDNEPILSYAPGSPEKKTLKLELERQLAEPIEIPLLIGGKEVRTGNTATAVCPHDHQHVLATYHQAGPAEVQAAIDACNAAWLSWSETPWEHRAAVILKAAELLAGPWRATLNAATMLNQSKTAFQAEIDSACELIDFWRFNVHYLRQILEEQPSSGSDAWNRVEYRALEGFVFAIAPFNFTAIGGNLPTAPALMGNTVLLKPASTAVLSSYYVMKILQEAGLPDGVINFVPGRGREIGDPVLASPDLAGIHFTGSTGVFQGMWRTVGENIANYKTYPRIVGETGGKDFVFAHPSSDTTALATALVRGSFEFQGQKCSAASRAYVPKSIWGAVEKTMLQQLSEVEMGSPVDFRNFVTAVIDESSFDNIMRYIELAKTSDDMQVIAGGNGDKSKGYFIEPTVVVTTDPRCTLMEEEIFGPVMTIYVYDDADFEDALTLCDSTGPYALTGAIWGRDRQALVHMSTRLRHAAGNFYINDKPTGAVVGQQPFGGSRASGTNDKAGSAVNLLRWTSMRTIKETFVPPHHFSYPFLGEE